LDNRDVEFLIRIAVVIAYISIHLERSEYWQLREQLRFVCMYVHRFCGVFLISR